MSAPDRIWIDGAVNANVWAEQKTDCTLSGVAAYEYVRADLCDPTQDERVKALVDALREFIYETTHLSPLEDDGSHWCKISDDCLETARAFIARHKKETDT